MSSFVRSQFLKVEHEDFRRLSRTLKAETIEEALAGWRSEFDEHGDLVSLESDSVPPESFFEVLAKYALWAGFLVEEDERLKAVWLHRGKVLFINPENYVLQMVGQPPKVLPGATVELRFRVNPGPAPESITLSTIIVGIDRFSDPAAAGIESIEYDGAGLRTGEERSVKVALSPSARGPIRLHFDVVPKLPGGFSLDLEVDAPPEPRAPWQVIESRTGVPPLKAMLGKGDLKKALLRARRFAARHAHLPGGEFLSSVSQAESLDDALAAAGLEADFTGAPSAIRFIHDTLPGAEPLFAGLLKALSHPFPDPKWGLNQIELTLRYAHDADHEWRYRVGQFAGRERV